MFFFFSIRITFGYLFLFPCFTIIFYVGLDRLLPPRKKCRKLLCSRQ